MHRRSITDIFAQHKTAIRIKEVKVKIGGKHINTRLLLKLYQGLDIL